MMKLLEICSLFDIPGTVQDVAPLSGGIINSTYRVRGQAGDYLLQKINTAVFPRPEALMENVERVTAHLRRLGEQTLHFYPTREGRLWACVEGEYWRLCDFLPSRTYDKITEEALGVATGRAFGRFQAKLATLDSSSLHETIPDFHNTRRRFQQLEDAVAADPVGLVKQVQPEIDFLRAVRDRACTLTDLQQAGRLPLRVTHNDAKIGNVLFRPDGSLVVIDLDTVMPGLAAHDFGDAIRSGANTVAEDCPEADKARVNMEVFRSFAAGFLAETADTLTEQELDTLALGSLALTAEQAARFLADYILGSPYYKIEYPTHNLVRTRCQIALAKDLLAHMQELADSVRRCAGKPAKKKSSPI